MRYIHKVFHEKSASDFEKIYDERFHFDSANHFGMHIKPMNQPHLHELYYIPSNHMIALIAKIYRVSREFNRTFDELPSVAQKQFINECLVEELFNTNELEGIRSTREEIARSTKEVMNNKKTKVRFESTIKFYFGLIGNHFELPKTPMAIRQIYDGITNDEIDQQELPDGKIFRKEATSILKKSGTGKMIHQGTMPESKIIEQIETLLTFMNENETTPNLIKVAVGHYYFGYIHPFYDGNGRTSRFISSLYLSEDLGNISTLSLSRGCNKYKNKYLEAFEITNSIRSKGEMNSFIETFLQILKDALEQMNTELKEKSQLLNIAKDKLNREPKLKAMPKIYRETMFILAQNHFFDTNSGLAIRELSGILNKSDATVRKIVKTLLQLFLIEQKGERPAFYCINQTYFETE